MVLSGEFQESIAHAKTSSAMPAVPPVLGSRHHFGFTGISRRAWELRGAFRPILDRVMAVATGRAQRHRWAQNHLHDQHAPCIRQPRKSQVEGHSFPSLLRYH